jgi:hypothetical protein
MEVKSQFSVPILFLVFNRPDNTSQVFAEIRKIKPRQLFIAADGPRNNRPGEQEKCNETRAIVKAVDWECSVQTLFREQNLGCKNAVSSAISWFFSNVDEGIILEDDCVPNQSFFPFCEMLLEKYRNDPKIMQIGGSNFHPDIKHDASYYFSNYNHIWGWASWKRAWEKYDVTLRDFPEFLKENRIDKIFGNSMAKYQWLFRFWKCFQNKIDTWDYQWTYTIWNHEGVSIVPAVNLVSNIGFNEEATHTKAHDATVADLKTESLSNLIHPSTQEIHRVADERTEKRSFKSTAIKKIFSYFIVKLIKMKT